MSPTLRRWGIAVAGFTLALAGALAFAKGVGVIGDRQVFLLWVAFPVLAASRVLLTRVFGAGRFRGLALAGERLGLTLDRRTGELVGRVRGFPVRVYPTAMRRQAAVEVTDGVSPEPHVRRGLGDPWAARTATMIADQVRALVSDAEREQRRLAERMKEGAEHFRAATVRRMAAVPVEMRVPQVSDALALALRDDSKAVRLAAGAAKGSAALTELFDAEDVPWLVEIATGGDEAARRDAAHALAFVGTIDSLALLKAAPRTPEAERAIAAIQARTRVEGGRISIAPAEGGEVSIARQAGELSKTKE